MTDETKKIDTNENAPGAPAPAPSEVKKEGFRPRNTRGGRPSRGPRPPRPKAEFEQKTLDVRRVTRVASGGRRFTFSVTLVVGDKNGRVGVGIGKGADTALAIDKAFSNGRKNLVLLKRTETGSIPHETKAKFKTSRVTLFPNGGRGLVAGSSVRSVLEFAGLKDVTAQMLSRSKNALNNARVAMKALEPFIVARGAEARKTVKKEEVPAKV